MPPIVTDGTLSVVHHARLNVASREQHALQHQAVIRGQGRTRIVRSVDGCPVSGRSHTLRGTGSPGSRVRCAIRHAQARHIELDDIRIAREPRERRIAAIDQRIRTRQRRCIALAITRHGEDAWIGSRDGHAKRRALQHRGTAAIPETDHDIDGTSHISCNSGRRHHINLIVGREKQRSRPDRYRAGSMSLKGHAVRVMPPAASGLSAVTYRRAVGLAGSVTPYMIAGFGEVHPVPFDTQKFDPKMLRRS